MRSAKAQSWVVYSMPVRDSVNPMRFVCEQLEWEAMNRAKPGFYSLIQAGIENEGEAERLARGSSGETRPRNAKKAISPSSDEVTATTTGDLPSEN